MTKEYLNNKQFELILTNYRKHQNKPKSKAFREAQTELVNSFRILTDNIVRSFKFAIDQDDARQEGQLVCLLKMHCFDFNRGCKAFNYFTTMILNHFRQIYRKEKKYMDLKQKLVNEATQRHEYPL